MPKLDVKKCVQYFTACRAVISNIIIICFSQEGLWKETEELFAQFLHVPFSLLKGAENWIACYAAFHSYRFNCIPK